MKLHDHALFFTYFRMSPAKYEHQMATVAPGLQKCSEKRDPICLSERLSVTFRYLFTSQPLVVLYVMVCYQCLLVGCMPLLFIIVQTAVLFTRTRHATKLSDWLLKSCDVFSARKGQKKLNLIQLSSEQNRTENFPVHVTHTHAYELFCSVPARGKFL